MFTINKNPTVTDLHKFGWSMLAGFGVIGVLLWVAAWRGADDAAFFSWSGGLRQGFALGSWLTGFALWAFVFLARPSIAKPVYVAWMTVAVNLGIVMSTIGLTLLFVLFLPPFSAIVRFGDPLRRRRKPRETYWEDHKPHEPTLERMARPF